MSSEGWHNFMTVYLGYVARYDFLLNLQISWVAASTRFKTESFRSLLARLSGRTLWLQKNI